MLRAGGRVGLRPDRPALFRIVKVNFGEFSFYALG
jgi:hypothetical protein